MQVFRQPGADRRCRHALRSGAIFDAETLEDRKAISGREYGRVPAHVIADILLAPGVKAGPGGFHISNAYIAGHLVLHHAVLKFPVTFTHCHFEHAPSFSDMSVPGLGLAGETVVPGLTLCRAVINSDLNLAGLRSTGTVDASGMQAGSVDLSAARLHVRSGTCLVLDGSTLRGKLNLRAAESAGSISACDITVDEMDAAGAILSNADGEVLNFTRAVIKGSASLSTIRATGTVSAFAANVGQLDLAGARLQAGSGTALELSRAVVAGTAFCSRATVTGAVNAADASFGELVLTGARLKVPGSRGRTLNLARVRVEGNLALTDVHSSGTIFMFGARIGRLDMRGTTAEAGAGTAVEMSKIAVTGTADCTRMRTTGSLHAADAAFAQLNLQSAVLHGKNGIAANFARVKVAGKTTAAGITAVGQFTAQDAAFGSVLNLDKARFIKNHPKASQPEAPKPKAPEVSAPQALTLDGANIGNALTFRESLVIGTVSATGLRSRSLNLTATRVYSPKGHMGIDISRADITDLVRVQEAVFRGTFRAVGAGFSQLEIRSTQLYPINEEPSPADAAFRTASVSRPGPSAGAVSPKGIALHLDHSVVSGDAILDAVQAKGEIRAVGATFEGKLILAGGTSLHKGSSEDDESHALGLDLATVRVLILEKFTADGGLNLRGAKIGALYVDEEGSKACPPALSSAQGWELGAVHGDLHTKRQRVQVWLDTMSPKRAGTLKAWWFGQEFVSQPWKEMASVFERSGQPAAARRLRFAAARRTTRFAPAWSKPVRWLYAAFAGYGYYPLIVIPWLALIGVVVFVLASDYAPDFTPNNAGGLVVQDGLPSPESAAHPAGCPQLQPVLFALETALPAADTGQARACRVTGNSWLPIVVGACKALGWFLIAVLLAGVSGLLRKE